MKEKRILWLLIICLASVLLAGIMEGRRRIERAGWQINELPVNIRIESVPPQLDDTDKIAVSLYGTDSAAGDAPIVTINGGMRVVSTPYLYSIVEGDIPDHYPMRVGGHNDDVGATYETVRASGTPLVYLTSATQLLVASDDADDDDGDTGARTVLISGLDGSYDVLTETITMNGTANVTTTNSFLRVAAAVVQTAGTSLINEGVITVTNTAGDNLLLTMHELEGVTDSACFTIPAGHTGYIVAAKASEVKGKETLIGLFVKPFGMAFYMETFDVSKEDVYSLQWTLPGGPYTEKTDLEIRAAAADGSGRVSCGFLGWYEAN